jgi:SPP1 gp7 family putative phage head morphogenesis protein
MRFDFAALERKIALGDHALWLDGQIAQRITQLGRDLAALMASAPGDEAALQRLVRVAYDDLIRLVGTDLTGVAGVVVEDVLATLADALPPGTAAGLASPPAGLVARRALESRLLGGPMAEWWAQQAETTRLRLIRAVRQAIERREGVGPLAKLVRDMLQVPMRDAQALARTAMAHVEIESALEVYRGNTDIAPMWEWLATLDSRTTPYCRSQDGKRYRFDDETAPRPPAHWNCRSDMMPLLDYKGLGLPEPPRRQTYADWLREQPESSQKEILGPARARLFRAGEVTLDDLVRRDGRPKTLAQLRELLRKRRARRAG